MDNLFDDFFPKGLKSKEEGFSVSDIWKSEITKWLACAYELDPIYYERSKTRVKQDTLKQEEVLAELRSIYFLKQHGCTILALEPDRVDIHFTDKAGTEWLAEVKCPSYEREIMERDISTEEKIERKKKPKYINEPSMSFNFVGSYAYPIRKSVDKFKKGENNLLIISDNLFLSLSGDPFFEENIAKELLVEDTDEKISTVLLLDVVCYAFGEGIEYHSRNATITKELILSKE